MIKSLLAAFRNLSATKKILVFMVAFASIGGGYMAYSSFAAQKYSITNREIEIEGELETVIMDDFDKDNTDTQYNLLTHNGKRIPVFFSKEKPKYDGVAKVKIKGRFEQNKFKVQSSKPKVKQIRKSKNIKIHKTAVVLFNFKDADAQNINKLTAKNKVFTNTKSVNAFLREESFGKLGIEGIKDITGDVFGYYTINSPSNSCEVYKWSEEIFSLALKDGHDLNEYDNVIFTDGSGMGGAACRYGGFGQIGGKLTWIFSTTYAYEGIVAHELTHNFGTWHANLLTCVGKNYEPVPISDDCTSIEYGDSFDVMGTGYDSPYHSNNYFLNELGFLPNKRTITKSGDYFLQPIETATSDTKSTMRIIRSIDQFNNVQYYYLEYRQPFGFDNFAKKADVSNGTMIRLTSGSNYYIESKLLQIRNKNSQYFGLVMKDGDVFNDVSHSIKIKQLYHNRLGVMLHIDVDNVPQLDTTPPSIPLNLQMVNASTKIINIKWNASLEPDVSMYNIYRNGINIGSAYPSGLENSVPEFSDEGNFVSGETINYSVSSVDFAGNESAQSNKFSVVVPEKDTYPPSSPGSLVGEFIINNEFEWCPCKIFKLSWQPSTDNKAVLGYAISRKDPSGNISLFEKNIDTYFYDLDRLPDLKYTYSVQAYDSDLNYSNPSGEVSY